MDKVFSFGRQLAVGNTGEELFKRCYSGLKPQKSVDRSADFILSDGKKVELKTDTYGMRDTENFFMEMFGSIDGAKLGGPWRAMQDGVDYFVYHYIKDKTYFWFNTVTLCRELDNLIGAGQVVSKDIRNATWSSRGYLVPRPLLEPVQIKMDKF